MSDPISVKVSSRHQIALPSLARRKLKIQAGDRLLVDIQDGMLILVPEPADYTAHLAGLHQDVWKDLAPDAYLDEERTAWTQPNENS